MPYEIGRVFSGDVWNVLEGSRNRAASGTPPLIERTEKPVTDLQEAMIRAASADRASGLQFDLGLLGLDQRAEAERAKRDLGYYEADLDANTAQAELARKAAADESLAGYREGTLDLRSAADEARAGRYAARSDYEQDLLALRAQEQKLAEAKQRAAEADAAARLQVEHIRNLTQVHSAFASITQKALAPDANGRVSQDVAAAFMPVINSLKENLIAKGLPAAEVEKMASDVVRRIGIAAGVPSVREKGGDVNPLLDLSLDDEEEDARPPRLGG
jgi:hypothetical protein